jgi:glycerol-3-phosphate acyltransferase PlsY
MLPALNVLLGFLLGSIPFGMLLARWRAGVDVRQQGSGNIGATNVARVAGKKLGALVLVLDASKGALPVLAALRLWPDLPWLHGAVALAAFLGHVFPPWLAFRGGKGVATAFGGLLALVPAAALSGLVAYALVAGAWKKSSLGSLVGGVVTVGVAFRVAPTLEYAWLAALLFGLMLWTHRGNLRRLWKRTERSF